MKTLHDLFFAEIADIYDAEKRLTTALPRLGQAAVSEPLRQAFTLHAAETAKHVAKLEVIFETCGRKAQGETCEATLGLLKEADSMAADFAGSPALDAALIAATQKIEHYEMATYGCLNEWAELLGYNEAARILSEIYAEEAATNAALTELARSACNHAALGQTSPTVEGATPRKVWRPHLTPSSESGVKL